MMLNLKYLIAPYGAYLDHTHMTNIASSGNVKLMQNNYYLPMGFMVDDDLLDYAISTLSASEPIDNQNKFFRLATGFSEDLYEYLDYTGFDVSDDGSLSWSSAGRFTYSSSSSSDSYGINYTAPKDGVAVAYYDTYYSDNVSLKVNGAEVISYYAKRPFIMMIGDVKKGDTITCSSSISNSSSGSITCRVAIMNEELFQKAYEKFKTSTMEASKVTDDTICGNINAAEDGLFYTSISFIEGWKAYVDGKEVEITPVGGAMLAFKLEKGRHIIEIRYTPEGFTTGLIISIAGLVIFAVLILLSWKKINLLSTVGERFHASGAYKKAYGDHKTADPVDGESFDDPADPTYTMNDENDDETAGRMIPDINESSDNET